MDKALKVIKEIALQGIIKTYAIGGGIWPAPQISVQVLC